MIDRAVRVALLADLCQLQKSIADPESRSHRKRSQVESFYNDILTKSTEVHIGSLLAESLDFLQGQKAYLPVPLAGMRVILDSPVRDKPDLRDEILRGHGQGVRHGPLQAVHAAEGQNDVEHRRQAEDHADHPLKQFMHAHKS